MVGGNRGAQHRKLPGQDGGERATLDCKAQAQPSVAPRLMESGR